MELLNNFKSLFLSVWDRGILGVDIFQILVGIGIFFIFLIFRGIISKVIIKRLESIAKRTTNKFDDTFVQAMVGPARFLPIVVGFFIASYYMSFSEDSRVVVDTINRTLITIFIFWVIHQIIEPISYILSGLDKVLTRELIGWIIKSLKVLIFILGLAAVLELWGIKIGPIIAGLGLFGVAVALGAQDLFKNLISGILVLVEKRFKIGDWILVEGIIEGIVEKIGFRSTVIRKFDKSIAIIPNFQFAENAVINISQTTNWIISWVINLQYDTTVEQLKTIRNEIEDYIKQNEDYKPDLGYAVRIDKFADSSIDMYIRCFTKTDDWDQWLAVKERLAISIKQIFIIGVPRCGSTLIEKIIASGSQYIPIGEETLIIDTVVQNLINHKQSLNLDIENFQTKIVETYKQKGLVQKKSDYMFTDKSLENFFYIDIIKEIFPQAKVINCRRNTLSSIMSTLKNNLIFMAWAHNLEHIFKYYDIYYQMIKNFKKTLPNFIYDLQYEKFVSDPENEAKKLMKFCGLPWDIKCLEFYKRRDLTSKTTSNIQIRKAIYKDSINKYLPYKQFLSKYGNKYSWFN
ncbi:mechanosensitive ion channel [Candidatus Pelagibacter sp.]|nr:mechanosensitive ion channel [Candidatus Pelagibacter sp.]